MHNLRALGVPIEKVTEAHGGPFKGTHARYVLRAHVKRAMGVDEDGEPVASAVVQQTEPVKKRPKLSAQQRIGMQALDDALTVKGEKKHGPLYPQNRRCVSVTTWRGFCQRHSLSNGESESAQRKAFLTIKRVLQEKELVRIVDDWVWRCEE